MIQYFSPIEQNKVENDQLFCNKTGVITSKIKTKRVIFHLISKSFYVVKNYQNANLYNDSCEWLTIVSLL